MIWDLLVRIGKEHPVLMRGVVGTASFVIFGYIALAAISSEIVEGNRASCERGNAGRLFNLRKATTFEKALVRQQTHKEDEGDMVEAQVAEEESKAWSTEVEGLKEIARSSGNENAKGAVTINCTDEWPKPLPWLGD